MRSGYSKDEFLLAAAKKKPRWQELINRVAEMSQEDIQALSEPLWVREALSVLKASGGKGQKQRIQDVLDASDAQATILPPSTHEVRLWTAGPAFVGTESNGKVSNLPRWQIEVNTGDSLMILNDRTIRINDSVISVSGRMMAWIPSQTRSLGMMTLDQYRVFHRTLLNQRHPL